MLKYSYRLVEKRGIYMSIFEKRKLFDIPQKRRKRGIIYCRVSDIRQVEGYSLEVQEKECRLLAETKDIEVIKIFKDEGVSGKTTFRDEFQDMLDYIMNNVNEVDYIIFYQLTRVSRKLLDVLELVELLNDLNIEFLSYKDSITDGAHGKFTIQLLGSLAELEISQLRERVLPSLVQRATEGKRNGGRYTPYGYYNEEIESEGKRKHLALMINEQEAKQVRLIYDLYVNGIVSKEKVGMHLITKHLLENGYRYRDNKEWTTKRVASVLSESNASLYNGYIEWGRYRLKPKKIKNEKTGRLEIVLNKNRKPVMVREQNDEWVIAKGEHEPIITSEVYELFKKRKESVEKPTTKNKGRNAVYHLTSVLHCQDCGGVMDASNEAHGLVYKCRRATAKPGTCHSNTIKYDYIKEDVELVFFSYLKLMILANMPKIILANVIKSNKDNNNDKRIIEIKAEMNNLMDLYNKNFKEFESINNPSEFKRKAYSNRLDEIEIQYNELEKELKELEFEDSYSMVNDNLIKNIINYLENINNVVDYYNGLDLQLQIDLYRKIFEKIIVRKDLIGANGKSLKGKKSIRGIEFYINFNSINFFDLGEVIDLYDNKKIIETNEKIQDLIGNDNYFNLFNIIISSLNTLNQNVQFKINEEYFDSKEILTKAQIIINYGDIKFDDSVLQNLNDPEIIEIESNLTEEDKLFLEQLKVKENGEI